MHRISALHLVISLTTAFHANTFGIADAATISRSSHPSCDLQLSGPIETGDVDRLRSAISGVEGPLQLCLDSPGGNYSEGMRIVNLVLASPSGIGMVVERGQDCASACAFIFLSGHVKATVNGVTTKLPDRTLHVLGSLGFHGPHIRPGVATYDAKLVPAAHAAGLNAVGYLLSLDEEGLFPLSLLGAGLEKGPDEFLSIDTVGQAGAWHINLAGYRTPSAFKQSQLEQACDNTDAWDVFEESPEQPRTSSTDPKSSPTVAFKAKKFRKVLEGYGGEGTFNCYVDALDARPKGIFFKVQIGNASDAQVRKAAVELRSQVNERLPLRNGPGTPLYYVYSPNQTLKSIAAE